MNKTGFVPKSRSLQGGDVIFFTISKVFKTLWGMLGIDNSTRTALFRVGALVGAALFGTSSLSCAYAAPESSGKTLMLFGDSLMAGYGLSATDGFAPQLQQALGKAGYKVRLINSSVSGDTTSAGLARLDWALVDKPDAVLLELGANDALRGTDPSVPRENLQKIIIRLKQENIPVLLAGMMAPPNLGKEYSKQFNSIYPDLAEKFDVALYPFFLDGVAAQPDLNQQDGIHPNPEGVKIVVKRILPSVIKILAD